MQKENVIKKISKFIRVHPKIKIPALLFLFFYITVCNILIYIYHNISKLIFAFSAAVVFIICSSTAFNSSGIEMFEKNGQMISENQISQQYNDNYSGIYTSTLQKNAKVYDFKTEKYCTPDYSEDWSLILVNKTHLIPEDYEVNLGTVNGNIKCDLRILDNVNAMIQAAADDGVYLVICSPYRDYNRQVMLFERKIKTYLRKGLPEQEARDKASETVAYPGSSEHQLGLAFDFMSSDYHQLDAGFANTQAGIWLKENGADYGFILRYPENKTNITQIEFEPWHYRYVGPAAHEIMDNDLCLEEYVVQIGLIESFN